MYGMENVKLFKLYHTVYLLLLLLLLLLPLLLSSCVVICLMLYCSAQIHENMLCMFKVVLSVIGSIQT